MPQAAKRGDRAYVNTIDDPDQIHKDAYLAKSVYDAEKDAVDSRRRKLGRDTQKSDWTGLALSGGGIRSASFGLGVLQALEARFEKEKIIHGIAEIDFLSTVSGGGYIGCSLTAALQKTKGIFPFTNPDNYDDTPSVSHIRDFSNYLAPIGALDVATALGIIGRGLVANILIVLPVLLFCVWITLAFHPNVASLGKPLPILQQLIAAFPWLPVLPSWRGYWITAILVALNLLFLFAWALCASMNLGKSATLRGRWVFVSKLLFLATAVTAFFETQPFILWIINPIADTATAAAPSLHERLHALSETITYYFTRIGALFGPLAAVFAFLSKYLGDIVSVAKRATGWQAWFKKLAAMAALWLAGLLVPIFLWLCYLWLVDIGLDRDLALWSYFFAFVLSTFVAFFINPNRTSLFRLYRDRLSTAFLFDPESRDERGNLQPFEPELKLYDIETDYCPYPIVNAALNIEASQYTNKRGRNADFFIFTPEYTGSGATGYIGTRCIKKDPSTFAFRMGVQESKKETNEAAPGHGSGVESKTETEAAALDLGTAMAISGAAISSNMGAATIKPLTFTLALLNLRLGYWLRNPRPDYADPPKRWGADWFVAGLFKLPSIVLFAEMFSWISEKSPLVYLTDGGHIENLGVYSLLKRRCKLIIAVDAEADPEMGFGAFLTLERYARIDLGVVLDLPWKAIRDQTLEIDKAFGEADKDRFDIPSLPGPHCAACHIVYGPNKDDRGVLLYVKASLSGDEADYILDYKRRNRAFPHETTGDQFFSEEQLEAYRALGFHIVAGLLTDQTQLAVKPDPGETEDSKRARIIDDVKAALLGSRAVSP